MSYEKFYPNGWQSGETGGTPITPEALNHIENGLKQTYSDFAPAGYGLGESDHNIPANGSITIKFNSDRHVAIIAVQGATMNNRSVFVVNTYGSGGIRTHIKRLCGEDTILYGILPESADNTNGIVLFNQSTDGYVSASILILFGAYPEVTNGISGVTAEPFEWDNPPMVPGVEYRTTERWNGKPVYATLVDCQHWAVGKTVTTDITAEKVIRYCGCTSTIALPNINNNSLTDGMTAYVEVYTNGGHIEVTMCGAFVNSSAVTHVGVWYTKD